MKRLISVIRNYIDGCLTRNELFVAGSSIEVHRADVVDRLKFYLPDLSSEKIRFCSEWPLRSLLTNEPVLVAGRLSKLSASFKNLSPNHFNIDWHENPTEGWEWVRLVNFFYSHKPDLPTSKNNFTHRITALKELTLSKSYIFGTGPSLERAREKDWSDGYRIVCNTIVRDPELWKHINPHFIVAGDAIYHFGHTSFARAFLADLAMRLSETDTFFVYPQMFDKIVRRELDKFSERLIPVPQGEHQNINNDLVENFSLPALGNVLALLLLPLGCTLSRVVMLWGFDGRAPGDEDKPFWANSNRHTYAELIPELIAAHPRFFEHFVPQIDRNRYVNLVHGDTLDERLVAAEREGFLFVMMHPTWTPMLQKRLIP